jgi:hypothetical protein
MWALPTDSERSQMNSKMGHFSPSAVVLNLRVTEMNGFTSQPSIFGPVAAG